MNTIYVLIMILSAAHPYGGTSTITQEFYEKETCEYALRNLQSPLQSDNVIRIRAQGCFKK